MRLRKKPILRWTLVAGALLLGACVLWKAPSSKTASPSSDPSSASSPAEEKPEISSLPNPAAQQEQITPPPLNPDPPVLTLSEGQRQLRRILRPSISPVTSSGNPLVLLQDLNRDGDPEGFALGIPYQEEEADAGRLSGYSRLYSESGSSTPYFLVVLGSQKSKLSVRKIIPLGEWRVFESFRARALKKGRNAPLLVSCTFQTQDGLEELLFVFDGVSATAHGSQAPEPATGLLCQLRLKRTLSEHAEIKDIDHDGVLDLFRQEMSMEEGTGVETFLSWHRWDGERFAEYRTVNVVRNLNTFLGGVKALLMQQRYGELVRRAMDPAETQALQAEGLTAQAIVYRLLHVPLVLNPDGSLAPESEIRDIIYPEILENPFSTPDPRGSLFRPALRIVTSTGESLISQATLILLSNPFGERQFVLSCD